MSDRRLFCLVGWHAGEVGRGKGIYRCGRAIKCANKGVRLHSSRAKCVVANSSSTVSKPETKSIKAFGLCPAQAATEKAAVLHQLNH